MGEKKYLPEKVAFGVIKPWHESGLTYCQIADKLNAEGYVRDNGAPWGNSNVSRLAIKNGIRKKNRRKASKQNDKVSHLRALVKEAAAQVANPTPAPMPQQMRLTSPVELIQAVIASNLPLQLRDQVIMLIAKSMA